MLRSAYRLALWLIGSASLALAASGQVGAPYCTGTGCPCGNDDPAAGCGNLGDDGDPTTGARIEQLAGSADYLLDDLALAVRGVRPGALGVVFMGGGATHAAFGDGLRCVGAGGAGIVRLPIRAAGEDGSYSEGHFLRAARAAVAGGVTAGSTWYFQGWYRDPNGPCGSGFNLTNGLPVTFLPPTAPIRVQLAGEPLAKYPWFHHVQSFLQGAPVHAALDTKVYPFAAGQTADVFVVATRTAQEWEADPVLVDVAGGPITRTFDASGVQSNTFVVDPGTLNGTQGDAVGVGYDVVIDLDRDGLLGAGDLIDGYDGTPGFHVVRDTAAMGPHAVVETLYNGGGFLVQDIYYPADVADMAQLPVIVVSHGNGHNYMWYDHIGYHMASYGYIVMSHRNDTVPGIENASTTTLTNTDHLIGNQANIAGGVLAGHIDAHRIVWMGHSRGGEGVVRAYDRLFDGTYTPQNFTIDDVKLISSIAPTNFLGTTSANPHGVDYHLWVGSADADVSGAPSNAIAQSFQLYERAIGRRANIVLQGAGHAVFHNGGGSNVATGPCQISPVTCHSIMQGYLLPLVRFYLEGDVASEDFLWRQYESFRPPSAPPTSNTCVVVHMEYEDGPAAEDFVIDDSQKGEDPGTSSSHGTIFYDVTDLFEGRQDDLDNAFTWTPNDPPNGLTRASTTDFARGVVFSWNQPSYYELGVVPMQRDFTDRAFLSFRACQGTRHPNTIAELGDLGFTVTLTDDVGTSSSIAVDAYGGGVGEPYQRTGEGGGVGWGDEFETFRIRLTDFLADGSDLRLWDVQSVRFEFGGASGSGVGRMGLDDVVVTRR